MQNEQENSELSKNDVGKLVVVSIGRHTRLGDILEYALAGQAFETVDMERFFSESWTKRRLLFAISADESDGNAHLHTLTSRLLERGDFLENCVCAAIVDGAQGSLAHLDALALLLAANRTGAYILPRPLIEADRELRYFSGGRESSFERYRASARQFVERLVAAESTPPEHPRVRFVTALEGGAAHDWSGVLEEIVSTSGGTFEDIIAPDETVLLCENTDGLPDERTLALLNAAGTLRLILASPTPGGELYTSAIIEHACIRGNDSLAPRGVLVFEGLSAVEVLASKRELERVKAALMP